MSEWEPYYAGIANFRTNDFLLVIVTGGPQATRGGVREHGDKGAAFGSLLVPARGAAAPGAAAAEGRSGHEARERGRLRGRGPVLDAPQALHERVGRRRLRECAELQDCRRRRYSIKLIRVCCLQSAFVNIGLIGTLEHWY